MRWLQSGEHIFRDSDVAVVTQRDKDQHGLPILDLAIEHCQVTEFEAHSETFIEVVKRKLKPGYDGRGINLVVNVRDKSGWTFLPQDLADEVSRLSPTYRSVWLICNDVSDSFVFHLVRFWPAPFQMHFNALESFEDDWSPEFIRINPKFASRVDANVGEYALPLADCNKCDASHP